MYKKDYEILIFNRIDKNFDKIMPIASIVAFGSALVIILSPIGIVFGWIDMGIGFLFAFMYFVRKRINTDIKVLTTITIPMILGIITFIDGGFSSGTITLILISNSVAVLFLSRRYSALVALASILALLGLGAWDTIIGFDYAEVGHVGMWVIQIGLVILFIFIFQVVVYAIRHYLLENIEELEAAVELTYSLAYYDQLTNLPNLNLFMGTMHQRVEKEAQKGYLVMFSIKSLNVINSVYGIEMGDVVLGETARCLNVITQEDVFLARVSGNEFVIWIEERFWKDLDKNIQHVINEFFEEFEIDEVRNSIEHLICYTEFNSKEETIEVAYQKVNSALTYAKQHETVEMIEYNEVFEERIKRTSNLRQLLKDAIYHREIELYYQSKVDALSEKVVGVEALARWHTKDYGNVGPDEFVPMTEDMMLTEDFGKLVVERVIEDYAMLVEKYGRDITVSINISPTFLTGDGFVDYITMAFEASALRTSLVIIEITEEIVIEGIEEVNEKLDALRKLGFKISLDDFGTGYSSLNYLSRLSVDELKVDKVLVDNICDDERNSILLETIIHLSKQYNLDLVAEGVETKEQKDKLISVGCTTIQGYYYSKPEGLKIK